MNRRSARATTLTALAIMCTLASCGKRGDPLPPYVKTPQPTTGLEISQIGNEIEIRIAAPRTTTQNRTLPVIQLEWLKGPPKGDWNKVGKPFLREEAAPGELRTKRFPRPIEETRFSVRAFSGKAVSANGTIVAFKPAAVPDPPTGLTLVNLETGIELRWLNPPGAEPWPTATPTPTPIPSASPSPTAATLASRTGSPTPQVPPVSVPLTGAVDSKTSTTPTPTPRPTPTPAPPTGIRIFRTDGTTRPAREPLQASSWLDTNLKPGSTPCYALRYATSLRPLVESESTPPVCAEFKDIVAPDPPGRLIADIGDKFIELSWLASPSLDIAFYRVYKTSEQRPRAMLLETQGAVLRVRDSSMESGPRTYEVAAVDTAGNESKTLPLVRIVVP